MSFIFQSLNVSFLVWLVFVVKKKILAAFVCNQRKNANGSHKQNYFSVAIASLNSLQRLKETFHFWFLHLLFTFLSHCNYIFLNFSCISLSFPNWKKKLHFLCLWNKKLFDIGISISQMEMKNLAKSSFMSNI